MKKWFIKHGHTKLFKSSHFAEFKALIDALPKRKSRQKIVVEEPVVSDKEEVVAVEPQPVAEERGVVVATENPLVNTNEVITVVDPQPVVEDSTVVKSAEEERVVEEGDTFVIATGGAVGSVEEEANVPISNVTTTDKDGKIEEKGPAQFVPRISLPQNQDLSGTVIPAFGMADVKAVVSYLEHLMGLIELATKDYQAAEIEYQRAKQEFDRIDARLKELNKSFGDIKDALVNFEKAETHLANVLEQYLPQQNIVH